MYKTTTEVICLDSKGQQALNETSNIFVNCSTKICGEQIFIDIQLNFEVL